MRIHEILENLEAHGRVRVMKGFEDMPDVYANTLTIRRIGIGEYLVRDSEEATGVHFLLRGSATAVYSQPGGEEYPFATFWAPTVIGEFEALAERRWYRSSVLCKTECWVARMPSDAYLQWVRADSELLYARTREIIRALTYQARLERSQLFLSAQQRICLYLCDSAGPCDDVSARGGKLYEVRATRRQIGDGTGYSEKTVQRELGKLAREGNLTLRRGRIQMTVEQLSALNERAGRRTSMIEEEQP
ncbi:MAG: Crp/Fnr family transcriptional regulator [Clostridia bacterium]|nr:Crp/Fnr family transcriptional regulator [Clostridia bacterium]